MQDLAERFAIIDAVYGWCRAIDARDWSAMKAMLTETVAIDYSSNGTTAATITAQQWIERLGVLYGFDATLHIVTNLSPSVGSNTAKCVSYVSALHFLTDAEHRDLHAFGWGVYEHCFVRIDGRWKINAVTFTLSGRHSGEITYDESFAAARSLAIAHPEFIKISGQNT